MRLAVVKFDALAPLPDGDEHVPGFSAADGWDIEETAPGHLTVTRLGKTYHWRGYPYGALEMARPLGGSVNPPPTATVASVDGPGYSVVTLGTPPHHEVRTFDADRPTEPALVPAKRQRKAKP